MHQADGLRNGAVAERHKHLSPAHLYEREQLRDQLRKRGIVAKRSRTGWRRRSRPASALRSAREAGGAAIAISLALTSATADHSAARVGPHVARLLAGSGVSQLRRSSCLIGCRPDHGADDETGADLTCPLKNRSSSSCGRRRSRLPTGCWAASPKPRTSSRRRCCASIRRSSKGEQITSPRAYVATVTTRLAINELRAA